MAQFQLAKLPTSAVYPKAELQLIGGFIPEARNQTIAPKILPKNYSN